MPKYRCTLDVDKEWVDRFNLVFDVDDEQDAESEAMIQVKENLSDYITVYVDEEKEIDVQSNTKKQIQREEDRSKRSSKSDV
jgi:hypothetical protein